MPVTVRSRSLKIKTEPEENPSPPVTKSEPRENPSPPVTKRRAQTKVELSEEKPICNVEEIRRKNIEDNKAFLEGLLMTQIRDDFKSLTNTLQPSIKKEGKKRDPKFITVKENVPVRRSRRLAHMNVDGIDNDMDTTENQTYRKSIRQRLPELTPEEQQALNEKLKIFFQEDDHIIETKKSTYQFSDLEILDENVLKLTPDRLVSMDIHSRSDIVAIIGCDRKGTIGLVVKSIDDIKNTWCKINYDFHTEYATCCRFDNFKSNCINSTSYDSTFRTCDIAKNLSIETFKDPDNHVLTAFDYHSLQTCLVSEDNGDVLLLDIRANPVTIERFDVSKKRIRTLHINPIQSNEFCISGTENCVKIWDLRNMSKMKYGLQTNYSCYGAYYNQAGSHIMATSRNDYLLSFSYQDIQHATDPYDISSTKRLHHRNYVNRFVTPFTAQPYPLFESYFLVGSNNYPREITVIDENCKRIFSFKSENLNSLATINIAHRTLPIVVAGNSSGRIHVFTGHI